eukprot:793995-Pyramimonas_sp.AAC.1
MASPARQDGRDLADRDASRAPVNGPCLQGTATGPTSPSSDPPAHSQDSHSHQQGPTTMSATYTGLDALPTADLFARGLDLAMDSKAFNH